MEARTARMIAAHGEALLVHAPKLTNSNLYMCMCVSLSIYLSLHTSSHPSNVYACMYVRTHLRLAENIQHGHLELRSAVRGCCSLRPKPMSRGKGRLAGSPF